MSLATHSPEINASTEVIAAGIADWIRKVNEPFTDPERATYDYRLFTDDLKLPYDDEANDNGQRVITQHDQLVAWTADFLGHYDDLADEAKDVMLGRQIFCAQTYIAQLVRMQTMLQATDEADYLAHLPEDDVTDTGLAITVGGALRKTLADLSKSEPTVRTLTEGAMTLNSRYLAYMKGLYPTGHLYVGETNSEPAVDNLDLQIAWAGLVVEYVVFGASERGGELAAVPSLDPASTEAAPTIYFPFAS